MTSPERGLRSDLAADLGVAVSEVDAGRIERTALTIAAGFAKLPDTSLFDTEPAHFDRYLMAAAKGEVK